MTAATSSSPDDCKRFKKLCLHFEVEVEDNYQQMFSPCHKGLQARMLCGVEVTIAIHAPHCYWHADRCKISRTGLKVMTQKSSMHAQQRIHLFHQVPDATCKVMLAARAVDQEACHRGVLEVLRQREAWNACHLGSPLLDVC